MPQKHTKLKIRNLELKNPFFLAPMLEYNDIAFRKLCKKAGCGLAFTGMINPLTKQKIPLNDRPALQLFSTNEKGIEEFIKKHDKKVSLWDFNLGCPAKTARKLGFGSFLHHDLNSIEKIIKTMRKATNKPVTIKLRKSKHAIKIAKLAESLGIDAIAIHPRTQNQGYSGKPDLNFALKLKNSLKIKTKIIYSGDVNLENCEDLLKEFDFLMIGREAIGRPEIFAKLTNKKLKQPNTFEDYLKIAEKYSLPWKTIKQQAMAFTKSKDNAKELRLKIFKTKTLKQLRGVMS